MLDLAGRGIMLGQAVLRAMRPAAPSGANSIARVEVVPSSMTSIYWLMRQAEPSRRKFSTYSAVRIRSRTISNTDG